MTTPLLTMIRNRKWLSDHLIASFRTATKGLSIFAVGHMPEDEVSSINEMMEALNSAAATISQEYKEVTKIIAKVPKDVYEFTLLLRIYTNILYFFFGAQCPLYDKI